MTSNNKLASGHTYEFAVDDEHERQARDFKAYKAGMVRLSPGGWYLPPPFLKYADRIYNFEFRPNDVVIMTYPKMGTTWIQEIVWSMRNSPNLDHPWLYQIAMAKAPFIEMDMLFENETLPPVNETNPFLQHFRKVCPDKDIKDGMLIQVAEATPEPRTIKTHLPLSLFRNDMLDKCKIIYAARNPKDGVMSYLHHSRLLNAHSYVGTTDQFVKYFVEDELMFGPFWEHIREAWEKRNHPNMHFVFYEDLKEDTLGEIKRMAEFIGVDLTEKQFDNVLQHTSFENMKKHGLFFNSETEGFYNMDILRQDGDFFRKGKAGAWKEQLSPENAAKIDAWTHKTTAGWGLEFKYN